MSMIINPFVFGAAGGGGFDPTTITGCSMWMSGDDPLLAGLSDGAEVGSSSVWTDRVTGTRNWSGGASNRPLFRTSGPNGKPYLEFTASDTMSYSVAATNIWTVSAFTTFAVVRPQSNGSTAGTEFGKNIISPNGYVGICLFEAAGPLNKFRIYRWNGAYVGVNSTTTYALNTWYIVETWYDGTDLHIKVNNDTETTVAATNPAQLTDTPQMSWVTPMVADLAELDTWNVSLSSTDRDTVRNELASKYDITL